MIHFRCRCYQALRKPLDSHEWRVFGVFAVIGVLFAAMMGFIAVPTWGSALIGAVLGIPAGLLVGVQQVLWRRQHGPVDWSRIRMVRSLLITVGVLAGMWLGWHCLPRALFVSIILVAGVLSAVSTVLQFVQDRRKGKHDS